MTTNHDARYGREVCELQVTPSNVDPPIWRRIAVPRDLTADEVLTPRRWQHLHRRPRAPAFATVFATALALLLAACGGESEEPAPTAPAAAAPTAPTTPAAAAPAAEPTAPAAEPTAPAAEPTAPAAEPTAPAADSNETVPIAPAAAAPASARRVKRPVSLVEGWNLVGWTGLATPFDDAIASIVDQTVAAANFDATRQSYRIWNASAPSFLNSLDHIARGSALWLRVAEPIVWDQPLIGEPGPLQLESGFNLLTWTGPPRTNPLEGFSLLGDALTVAFAFDTASQAFTSFAPGRPATLNDLAPLVHGGSYWVRLDAPTLWLQPPSAAAFAPTG